MLQVQRSIDIDAPIELVWENISKITDIQDWSRSVNEAHYHTELQRGVGAGRTCDVPGFGTLVEDVTDWVENESFTLSVTGLPRFVKKSDGSWKLSKTENGTRATTTIRLETRYWLFGKLMERFVLKPQFGKALKTVQREFKTYVETGTPEVRRAA